MVQVCFVLDLRSLAPPLLGNLKQVQSLITYTINFVSPIISISILSVVAFFCHLFNIHRSTQRNIIIPNRSEISQCSCLNFQSLLQLANFYAISSSSSSSARKSATLTDKIGLCYVFKNRLSSSDEVLFQQSAPSFFFIYNLRFD